MNEDELLIGFAEDKIKQCIDRNMPTGTGFLDPHQQSVIRTRFGSGDAVTRIIYYGGYDDAERVMMICLPEYVRMPQQAGRDPGEINEVISGLMCLVRASHSEKSQASRTGRPLSTRSVPAASSIRMAVRLPGCLARKRSPFGICGFGC